MDPANELAADLDEVRANLGDHQHARTARAGVLAADAEAARLDFCDDASQPHHVGNGYAFTEFENDVARFDVRVRCQLRDVARRTRTEEGGDGHLDEEGRPVRLTRAGQRGPDPGEVEVALRLLDSGGRMQLVRG